MTDRLDPTRTEIISSPEELLQSLRTLRQQMREYETALQPLLTPVDADYQLSARNLVHYLAFRQHDLRKLQASLAEMGLSSLGRSESHCLHNLEKVIGLLERLSGAAVAIEPTPGLLSIHDSEMLLRRRTALLLGPSPERRHVRIMVTMPAEAADSPQLIADLLASGMNCMRINCAHDGPEEWERMVHGLRAAERSGGHPCKILMDVAGPKLRTGPVVRSAETAGKKSLLLRPGDHLIVENSLQPGRAAVRSESGVELRPAVIGCTLPGVFGSVAAGEAVWFDDGKIGGVIERSDASQFLVRITRASAEGDRLKGDRGINLPESRLALGALTEKDIRDLDFIVEHADLVGLSFVQSPGDVAELYARLREREGRRLGVILKIETRQAFNHLPDLLLAAMVRPNVGVMIARGDLAVECGYERLAELQEEMLWIAEAAHIPVVWATQVLEELAKTGAPTRAEVTDAAMSTRAECVMLNKGPHIVRAIRVLDDILGRMQAHQHKKQAMLRSLHVARLSIPARN